MMPQLLRELGEQWSTLPAAGAVPVSGTVIGIDRAVAAKVALLLFDASGEPVAVAKVARDPAGEASLHREHEVLRHLAARVRPVLRGELPTALGLHRCSGRLLLLQTVVPGRPMSAGYYAPGHTSDPAAVAADFTAAGAWLDAFQAATRRPAELDLAEDLGRVVDRYRSSIGWSDEEDALFSSAADRIRALDPSGVPAVGVHGDYWMGNLLLERPDQISGVVDWELGDPIGAPFRDLFKFPTSYGFYLDRSCPWLDGRVPGHPGRDDPNERWRRYGSWPNLIGFGHAYFGSGWFPDQVRTWIGDREVRLKLDPAAKGAFFPWFLAEQALSSSAAEFRDGYRCLVRAFAAEKESSWLWTDV